MMKPTLVQKTTLQQTLTPQQIQYLKLLQLPILQLEQSIKQELETNPFLEETDDEDLLGFAAHDVFAPAPDQQNIPQKETTNDDFDIHTANVSEKSTNKNTEHSENFSSETNETVFTEDLKNRKLEEDDSFDYYSNNWEDDAEFTPRKINDYDKDFEPFQVKAENSFYEDLLFQINLLNLTLEENLLAENIIGNIDDSGYLRRDLQEIVNETNSIIAEHNFNIQRKQYEKINQIDKNSNENIANKFALNSQNVYMLKEAIELAPDLKKEIDNNSLFQSYLQENSDEKILNPISIETAETVLKQIQKLEPPGIASRNIQECLIAQLNAKHNLNEIQKLALTILTEHFDAFSKKHFSRLQKSLDISEDELKDVFDEIRTLNPKPGGTDFVSATNTVIPDFTVKYDEENDDLIININDSTIPHLRVNSTYEKIRQETKNNKLYNKETKEWIREKYENARFFIQAVRQRSITMLMVMTAIAHRQRDFFIDDQRNIKPMIYKDISEDTGLDISTVCRIVNNKYVLSHLGTFELKYFFSEALPNDDGEEISTTVIKDRIKSIIETEPKDKPYSDEKLSQILKDEGLNVARRTIAKYRETLKIPVARLRKEI